jgi:hypothetical protein
MVYDDCSFSCMLVGSNLSVTICCSAVMHLQHHPASSSSATPCAGYACILQLQPLLTKRQALTRVPHLAYELLMLLCGMMLSGVWGSLDSC